MHMRKILCFVLAAATTLSLLPLSTMAAENPAAISNPVEDYTQFVDPFVGTDVDYGQLFPGSVSPYGLMKLSPDTYPHDTIDHAGYDYTKKQIMGFSHTRIEGVGGQGSGGDILVTPTYVNYTAKPSQASRAMNIVFDKYNKKVETASPGYYSVNLWPEKGSNDNTKEDRSAGSIKAEMTSDIRTGYHRYTLPQDGEISLTVDMKFAYHPRNRDIILDIEKLSDKVAVSGRFSGANVGGSGKYTMYFYMETNQPAFEINTWKQNEYKAFEAGKTITGDDVGAVLSFMGRKDRPLEVKVSVSPISAEQAKRDMQAEMPDWNFSQERQQAKQQWNDILSKVKVTSSKKSDPDGRLKKLFYTHLYHMFTMPMNATSTDGTYRAINPTNDVRVADGYTHYDSWTLWDDFKKYPIIGLVLPDVYADIVRSIADGLEAGMATWSHDYQVVPNVRTEHAVALLADGVSKGMTDMPNLPEAYEKAKEISDGVSDSTRRNRVDKMVEYCYDDWAISLLAKELYEKTGEEKYKTDYEKYSERAFMYKELYRADAVIPKPEYQNLVGMGEKAVGPEPMGLLWGKNGDGTWRSGNPESVGDQGLYQGSLWQYSFWDSNDVSGLMDLMGGKDAMYRQLSYLMGEYDPENGPRMLHTSTNEIDLHSPYLFNFVGRPNRTQYWTRQIYADKSFSSGYTGGGAKKDYIYRLKPDGYLYAMDDDAGTMASMYVAAAMGLFPVTPGDPTFQITSPFFEEMRLDVGNGKEFVIQGNNTSTVNKYIQSATLNGSNFKRTWLHYDEIARGGVLRFEMDKDPSEWAKNSPPAPSMSDSVDSSVYEKDELAYSSLTFHETAANDGTIETKINLTIQKDDVTINGTQGEEIPSDRFSVKNVPVGLTAKLIKTSEKTVEISLSGTSEKHRTSDSIDTLELELKDSLFSGAVNSKRATQLLKIQYRDDMIVYSKGEISDSEDGVFNDALTATITGDAVFAGTESEDFITSGKLSIKNIPEGLTVTALKTSGKTVNITFTGEITGDYKDRDGMIITFADNAFANSVAGDVIGSNYGGMKAIKVVSKKLSDQKELAIQIEQLRIKIAKAKDVDTTPYTAESSKVLIDSIAKAEALLADTENLTLEKTNAMIDELSQAMIGLTLLRFAGDRLEFESPDSNSGKGLQPESADGGTSVGYTYPNAWFRYGALDFGSEKAPTKFSVRYSGATSCYANSKVEVRIGDPVTGELVTSVATPPTGNWSTYRTVSVDLDATAQAKLTGIVDLYLVLVGSDTGSEADKNNIGNFNWAEFEGLSQNAFAKVELESKDDWTAENNPDNQLPLKTEASNDTEGGGTDAVANTFDGAWLKYSALNFGKQAPDVVSIRYSGNSANCYADSNVEFRLGALDGELLATVQTPPTNSAWGTWKTAKATLSDAAKAKLTGVKDLYVVFKGTRTDGKIYAGNFNWLQFETNKTHSGVGKLESETYDSWTTAKHPNGGPLKNEDGGVGGSIGNTFDGAWLKFDHIDFGEEAAEKITINYKAKTGYCPADARLEIRLGSPDGELVATVNSPATAASGWSNWAETSAAITNQKLKGIVDNVYFVFKGDMTGHNDWYVMNLDYVKFESDSSAVKPYNKMELELYTKTGGGLAIENKDGGKVIANTNSGEWLAFENVNFGDTAPEAITVRYAGATNCHLDAHFELRLGSPTGELVSKVMTPPTGSWDTNAEIRVTLDEAGRQKLVGKQDVYFVFGGSGKTWVGNFNWVRFEKAVDPDEVKSYGKVEAESRNEDSGKLNIENGNIVHGTYKDAWLKYTNYAFDGEGLGEISINYSNNASRMGKNAMIKLYLDDKNKEAPDLIIPLPVTSESSYAFNTLTIKLDTPITGAHDMYMVLNAETSASLPYVAKLDWFIFKEQNQALDELREIYDRIAPAKAKPDVQNDVDGLFMPLRSALMKAERVLNAAIPDKDELAQAKNELTALEKPVVSALLDGEMKTLIADAQALNEGNTAPDSLEAIANALIPAEAIDADSPFDEYQQAFTALKIAYDQRKPIGSKQTLAEKRLQAQTALMSIGEYLENSKNLLAEAIENAQIVLADESATPEAIALAIEELDQAIEHLVVLSDKAGLETSIAIAEEEAAKGNTYTEETLAALIDVLQEAKELIGRSGSSVAPPTNRDYSLMKKQLDRAVDALEKSMQGKVVLSDIENLDIKEGTEFTIPVRVGAFTDDAYRSVEGVVALPEKTAVVSVESPIPLDEFTKFDWHVEGNTLRFAFMSTNASAIVYDGGVLLDITMKTTADLEPETKLVTEFTRFVARTSEKATEFDLSEAKSTATVAKVALTAAATELYVGDGSDLIPEGKKAVSVVFTGLSDTADVQFSDVQFFYNTQRSEVNKQVVYVALVDADVTLDMLSNIDLYTVSESGRQDLMFGDAAKSGDINAQDALNVVSAWLRKGDDPTVEALLTMNVSCDGKIDTTDALDIVNKYIHETEFKVVTK